MNLPLKERAGFSLLREFSVIYSLLFIACIQLTQMLTAVTVVNIVIMCYISWIGINLIT